MKTHFAPPERSSPDEIKQQVAFAAGNDIINGVLRASSGILALLNENRQILAINETFLKTLGISNTGEVLGLRPGEALQCVHAHEMEEGCGTSEWCSTCGAAIAIVACQATDEPQERKCALTTKNENGESERCMSVRSCRVRMQDHVFILLYLQDITVPERRATLERIFLHDINNLITGLQFSADFLQAEKNPDTSASAHEVQDIASRLRAEVAIQSALSFGDISGYKPRRDQVHVADILAKLKRGLVAHLSIGKKQLQLPDYVPPVELTTDTALLLRVLSNLAINALEATPANGEIKAWVECTPETITFSVWNNAVISADIGRRLFQLHFSTKDGAGRGFGTYSAKLIGEGILKGKVKFTSKESDGTIFSITIPTVI